jgi:hypothetical protein
MRPSTEEMIHAWFAGQVIGFVVGTILLLTFWLTACSTAGVHQTRDGQVIAFASSIGEGALASVCFDTKASVETVKSVLAKHADLTPEQIDSLRFAQYPSGMCVAARGSSISKELERIAEMYLYSQGAEVLGDVVGGVGSAVGEAIKQP